MFFLFAKLLELSKRFFAERIMSKESYVSTCDAALSVSNTTSMINGKSASVSFRIFSHSYSRSRACSLLFALVEVAHFPINLLQQCFDRTPIGSCLIDTLVHITNRYRYYRMVLCAKRRF